jgi:hypothetical protein
MRRGIALIVVGFLVAASGAGLYLHSENFNFSEMRYDFSKVHFAPEDK